MSGEIGQYGYRYGEAAVTGVYLSTDERAVLRRLAHRSGLRSTRTPYTVTRHPATVETVPVIDTSGRPAEPMPWWFPTPADDDPPTRLGEVTGSAAAAPTDGDHPG